MRGIHTVGTWNRVCEQRQLTKAVQELDLLVHRGSDVGHSLFYCILKRCVAEKDLVIGSRVHALVVKSGGASNACLANHIICMYASHGRLEEATQVFITVPVPSRSMWASIITAHARHGQPKEALKLYRQMRESSVKPHNHIYVAALRACATAKDVSSGKKIHADILGTADKPNVIVGTSLVNMYLKCGSLDDAYKVFENLSSKNVVTWNAMISGYAQHGLPHKSIALYGRMQEEGITPANHITFVCLLQACASIKALHQGKKLHAQIQERGLEIDVVVGSCVVNMYAKCGSLDDARRAFDNLSIKNVVTWTAMIGGYAQHGLGQEALNLYARMQQEANTCANDVTFVCLLQACASIGALHQGKQLHATIKRVGLQGHVIVGNGLIDMYAKCGSLDDARSVFDNLPTKDVVTWNALLAGYAQHGLCEEAITLYSRMQEDCIHPANAVTFVSLFQACSSLRDLHLGKQLHTHLRERGLEGDNIVGNSLVSMYSKCGSLQDARRVFDNMPTKDVVTWNAMITGYAQHGLGQDALTLYGTMQHDVKSPANHVTFVCLLQACSSLGDLHRGKQLHAQIQKMGLEANAILGNCLVNMYSKCDSLEDARRVFDALPTRDVITWNAMIAGYAQHGLCQEALSLYAGMQQEGIIPADAITFACLLQACANVGAHHLGQQLHMQIQEQGLEADTVLANCLLHMYAKCGNLQDARRVFDNLLTRDLVTWNAMISGYAQHGITQEAVAIYAQMQQEGIIAADAVTFISVLHACSTMAGLDQGKEIHFQISEVGLEADVFVASTLVDMYSKCGSMVDAQNVFDSLPTRDIVTWNTLIAGYARQGESEIVLDLFHRLRQEGIQPDAITCLSLLTVCSHVGLVDKAQKYFEGMTTEYGVSPTIEHYNCMVDLLGRAGQVDKAIEMVKTMPFQAHVEVWRSILGACRKWSNVELGRQAFEVAVTLDRNDPAIYVVMADIYAAADMEQQANEIHAMRVEARAWKKLGHTWWTDISGIVHTFVAGSREHPESPHIYAILGDILVRWDNAQPAKIQQRTRRQGRQVTFMS